MNNKIVSIVVPMFNSQKYIKECVESIINQTYKDIQLIIVDDGSTDDSLKLCKELQKRDCRITVIEECNLGTAEARKNGINYAVGDYITFVDSDDYIVDDYIEMLISYSEGSQLVTSGLFYTEKIMLDGIKEGKYIVDSNSPVIKNMLYLDDNITRGILSNMCGKLFDTHIVKKVIENIDTDIFYGEDGEFVYKYILNCKNVCVTNYCGYYYRVNNQSVIHRTHENFLININKLYSSLKEAFGMSIYKNELMPQLEKWIARHIRLADDVMGFQNKNLFIKYIIPYKKMIAGKRVVIYGAGKVGSDYIRQIKKENLCEELIWVDKNYKNKREYINVKVESPDILNTIEFDYILIAVNSEKMAEEIKYELINKNIRIDKIIFQKPIYIEEFYT